MPPRIDPSEQTGKSRAQRIRLGYFHDRHWLHSWRWIAAALGALVAGTYLAWVSLAPGGAVHLSTGKISAAHASFDQACSQCHLDFVPIARDAWRREPESSITQTAMKCRQCHAGVGPHGAGLNGAGLNLAGNLVDQQCSRCHDEHQGRNHQLIPSADSTCTECHQDTSRFRELPVVEAEPMTPNVTRFSSDGHGEFRSLAAVTPETLTGVAFDHALHMQPGQVPTGRRGAMRLDRMPAEHRQRYQRPGEQDDAPVQLQCADCHQFQSASAGRVASGDFDWGRNSLPIRYDQHCIACHPLTVPGQREGQLAIAHGVPSGALRDSIRGHLAALDMADEPTPYSLPADGPPIRVPGRPAAGRGGAPGEKPTQRHTDRILQRVRQQCRVCHVDSDLDAPDPMPRIPQPRLRAGRFDHGAHRSVACLACHPHTDPGGRTVSSEAQPALADWLKQAGVEPHPTAEAASLASSPADRQSVGLRASDNDRPAAADLTLGIQSCVPCHRGSAPLDRGRQSAGELTSSYTELFGGLSDQAADRCTTCHQYHTDTAESPRIGSPSGAADARKLQALLEFSTLPAPDRLVSTQAPAANITASESASAVASPAAGKSSNSPRRLAAAAAESPSGQWIGSDSCATSTCHGGPVRQQPDWNSSQTVFEAYDPHARAALVLDDEKSRHIVVSLAGDAGASAEGFRHVLRTRCNGCHAPSDAEDIHGQPALRLSAVRPSASDRDEELQAWQHEGTLDQGLSCEACHGPASGWIREHLSEDWRPGDNTMRQNRDYVARLEGCVRCHVGSRRADGVVRDVNHDLIAAGHPPLRFEAWSALRRLPRHGTWARARDGLPEVAGEAELRRFLVGRVVALRAAIQLSVQRLEDASGGRSESVWPELAQYDCFACHHNLKIANFASRPRAGYPAPHPWLQTGLIEDGLRQLSPGDAERLSKAMETFRLRSAGGMEILPAAREVETILNRYLARLTDARTLPAGVVAWRSFDDVRALESQQNPEAALSPGGGWYDAAYWYLRSHVRLRDGEQASENSSVAGNVQRLADALQFGRPERGNRDAVDSPEFFDISDFRRVAKRLTDAVESD